MKVAIDGFVDLLSFRSSGVGVILCFFDARAGFFEHALEAGAGPWTHAEVHGVDVTQTVEAQDSGIDPAVDRYKGRITRCQFAYRRWTSAIRNRLARRCAYCRRFRLKRDRIAEDESCEKNC